MGSSVVTDSRCESADELFLIAVIPLSLEFMQQRFKHKDNKTVRLIIH